MYRICKGRNIYCRGPTVKFICTRRNVYCRGYLYRICKGRNVYNGEYMYCICTENSLETEHIIH